MDILNDNDDTNMEDSSNNNNNNNADSSLNDNNDNDDIHMADSNNDDNSNSGDEQGVIDHERLRALSNYADQNQDDDTWYWTGPANIPNPVGWPMYRPLSHLSEEEREEIRVGETRMVSHMNPRHYVGTGISLNWGEYYVPHSEMDDDNDDEEDSSLSSHEEAEEIDDEELDSEDRQAVSLIINDSEQIQFAINFDQLDRDVDSSNPTLMGMPDIILEKILHYSTEQPSEVCVVERVCKRIRRLTTGEEFWARHPTSTKVKLSLERTYKKGLPENCYCFNTILFERLEQFKEGISDLPFSRQLACKLEAIGKIRLFQSDDSNIILDVLGEEGECVADTFRTLSADVLSMMNHLGPEAHFRLRGDTIGYICELLQGYMIDRLEGAICLTIHKLGLADPEGISRTVQRDDIALAFRRQSDVFSFPPSFSSQAPMRWGVHGTAESLLDCSLSLPSSSGIIWRWPGDNCHDVLPPEAGRRIIRRLAHASGILEMSNEAFILAETELLHALGVLLVCSYESSVDMKMKTSVLGAEDELTYDEPTVSVDMFKTPPPPFQNGQHLVYTIVPGQIRTVAEERGITPYKVYGDVWVASSGFTKEEEDEIERSYYYEDEDDEEEESDTDDEMTMSNRKKLMMILRNHTVKRKSESRLDNCRLDDSNDSDIEAEIEEGEEDSVMDMDDYETSVYWDSNWADSHLSMLG